VPPESPTLGLTHLQLEEMLTAARLSTNTNDFALAAKRLFTVDGVGGGASVTG